MSQPILQVVIPAYGESPYLKETLESAVKNLPESVPILLLEDPSESNSVYETWKEFSDRVQYKKNNHRLGIADNFNECIKKSKAEYTMILGSDDLVKKDISYKLKNFKRDETIVAILTKARVVNKHGKFAITLGDATKHLLAIGTGRVKVFNSEKFLRRLFLGYWFYFPAVIWKTNIIKKYKFNNELSTALDLEMFIRLISDGYKIGNLKIKTISYRRHKLSQSSRLLSNNIRFEEEFYCHDYALTHFNLKNKPLLKLLIQMSLTLRLHIVLTLIKQLIIENKPKAHTFKLLFRKVKYLSERY